MSYEPTIWKNGDLITAEKLNKIENGINELNEDSNNLTIVHLNMEMLSDLSTETNIYFRLSGLNDFISMCEDIAKNLGNITKYHILSESLFGSINAPVNMWCPLNQPDSPFQSWVIGATVTLPDYEDGVGHVYKTLCSLALGNLLIGSNESSYEGLSVCFVNPADYSPVVLVVEPEHIINEDSVDVIFNTTEGEWILISPIA